MILVEDYQGTIPVEFCQNPMSGFRGDVLIKKVYGHRTTTDDGQRPITKAHPEHFVLR